MPTATAEPVTPPQKSRGRRPAKHDRGRQEVSRMEQELRSAKNNGTSVRFTLAVETEYTDDVFSVVGIPVEFDQGDVKIKLSQSLQREVWLAKAFIVSAEVLR